MSHEFDDGEGGHRRRLEELFGAHHRALLGYALRRIEQPADAADVASQVFVVAWRRIDDVPEGDEGRLWLYGVARRTLAYQRGAHAAKSCSGSGCGPTSRCWYRRSNHQHGRRRLDHRSACSSLGRRP